jgi:hypothetical protein
MMPDIDVARRIEDEAIEAWARMSVWEKIYREMDGVVNEMAVEWHGTGHEHAVSYALRVAVSRLKKIEEAK